MHTIYIPLKKLDNAVRLLTELESEGIIKIFTDKDGIQFFKCADKPGRTCFIEGRQSE